MMRLGDVALLGIVGLSAVQCGHSDTGSQPGDAQNIDGGIEASPDAALPEASTSSWAGLSVSGTTFVDSSGKEFIPRGLAPGEWLNIESYMINVDVGDDSPGLGETRLRNALIKAMGQAATDQFFATWEANLVTAADVALWASWGVNSVRLPINYHAISSAKGVYIEAGFQTIDKFVGWCRDNGIYVILDLHAAPGAQNCEEMGDGLDGVAHLWKEPDTYRQWTIDLWQTIAKRYANEPMVGGYDIFDEPYDREGSGDFSTGIGTLRKMYTDITAAIRAVDANHILFFEGTNWSSIDPSGDNGFSGLLPAWDPHMAWAFHKYWDDNTAAAIKGYLDLRTKSGRPVWNGETGEDNDDGWSGAMIKLLEANHIGWNEWTYKKVENGANYYSIKAPANWAAMTAYFKSFATGGTAAAPADASAIMMELANNAATASCTLQTAWLKETFNK